MKNSSPDTHFFLFCSCCYIFATCCRITVSPQHTERRTRILFVDGQTKNLAPFDLRRLCRYLYGFVQKQIHSKVREKKENEEPIFYRLALTDTWCCLWLFVFDCCCSGCGCLFFLFVLFVCSCCDCCCLCCLAPPSTRSPHPKENKNACNTWSTTSSLLWCGDTNTAAAAGTLSMHRFTTPLPSKIDCTRGICCLWPVPATVG